MRPASWRSVLCAGILTIGPAAVAQEPNPEPPGRPTPLAPQADAAGRKLFPGFRPVKPEEEKAIREDYSKLQRALLAQDGPVAARYASPATIAAYEDCRKAAISGTPEEIEALNQTQVFLVFQMRNGLSTEELEKEDGAGCYAWSVDQGNVRKESVSLFELDSFQINERLGVALAGLRRQGGIPVRDAYFQFVKTPQNWTLDFVSLMKLTEPPYEQMRRQLNSNKVDLVMKHSKNTKTGQPFSEALRQGPLFKTEAERKKSPAPDAAKAVPAKAEAPKDPATKSPGR